MASLAKFIDLTNRAIGVTIAWLVLIMVIVQFGVVVARHVFGVGDILAQEAIIYMHALVFMLGAAYTLAADGHVRVDIFYRSASPRWQAWVNFLGSVCLLIPVAMVIVWASWGYVGNSWRIYESSMESSGIPGVFLLKTAIPVFAILVGAQGLTMALNSLAVLCGPRRGAIVGSLLLIVPLGAIIVWRTHADGLAEAGRLPGLIGEGAALDVIASGLTAAFPVVGGILVVAGLAILVNALSGEPATEAPSNG